MRRLMSVAIVLISFVCTLASPIPVVADEDRPTLDLYKLGEIVYNTGSESCRTCHGADGTGTSRSDVNLSDPSTWKSVQYVSALKGTPAETSRKSLVQTLILLGARGWNEQNFAKLKDHSNAAGLADAGENAPEPFDEEMVGLASPNRKMLTKRAAMLMRKADLPRANKSEIADILAAAAVVYIEEAFIN
ncbi:MAG: hypothetical protein VYE04_04550 [Pseudomonadota bacterium]|nr:hypothetical protein [Pseudomonadota bacterium]